MATTIDGTTGITTPAESVTGTGVWSVGSTQLYKDASGNLGIGTSSPDALLTVNTIASFGDGAVTTPSIAHKGDLNTGFWFPAADTIAASIGGTEKLRVTSTGLGVGKTPTTALDVSGTVTATTFSGSGASLTSLPAPAALSTASGSAPSYSARAWVQFNGTGTVAITGSKNVSTISDGGVGIYTINFTTAMADANYSTVVGGKRTDTTTPVVINTGTSTDTYSTAGVGIRTFNMGSTATDIAVICAAIFD